MKSIKNWKTISGPISLSEAYKALESQSYNCINYDRLSIGFCGRIIDKYDDRKNLEFSVREVTSNEWLIMIPDDDKERILYKARDIVKKEHFLNLRHEKIDNMSIHELWKEISKYISFSNDEVIYRVIKTIVENKLYKKA